MVFRKWLNRCEYDAKCDLSFAQKVSFFVELNIGIENNDFFSNLEIHIANIKMIHYRNYTFLDQMNFSFIANTLRKLNIGTNLQSFQIC